MTRYRPISVLLVEDFAPVRQRLRSLLSGRDGIEIAGEAPTASEALRLFTLHQPEVVVLDIQLPDGNGIDVLRRIKSASPSCVVIMLTSHGAEAYREACHDAGADHFFHKATEFERIPETLEALLLEQKV